MKNFHKENVGQMIFYLGRKRAAVSDVSERVSVFFMVVRPSRLYGEIPLNCADFNILSVCGIKVAESWSRIGVVPFKLRVWMCTLASYHFLFLTA
jgi:hypothetical protein